MIRLSQTKGPVSSGRATLSSSGSGKARLDTNGKCKILGGYPWHQSRSARGEDSASSMGARRYELSRFFNEEFGRSMENIHALSSKEVMGVEV